jgi:5-methylcytosine-specific restriction endonuclease McrA
MHSRTFAHLTDEALLRELAEVITRDRMTTATLLALIAEVDHRRLYAPAGYSSMHAYGVEELRLSEDAASKRIQAARAARRFPALLTALAEGRLHLAAACLLAPHLTPENVNELIEAATHRRKFEIEQMLVRRFPLKVVMTPVRAITPVSAALPQHALAHAESVPTAMINEASSGNRVTDLLSPAGANEHAPGHVDHVRAEPNPSTEERYLLQFTIRKSTHEKLRYAQALLSHAVPSGDLDQVFDRALDMLIAQLESRRFGATHRPRPGRTSMRKRHIPTHVRRAVWERDEGRCTFVSTRGHRCTARRFLEFDHVIPVARGGEAMVDGIRLRCRAHNQYEAERTFGAGFMSQKREEARPAATGPGAHVQSKERILDILAGLRSLGCKGDEARRAAEFSETLHADTLEERMRAALQFLGRKSMRSPTPGPGGLRGLGDESGEASLHSIAGPPRA